MRKNASSAFWDKMLKKVLAKQNNANKIALSVRDYLAARLKTSSGDAASVQFA